MLVRSKGDRETGSESSGLMIIIG
ncbi:hypothetical protein LINPERPRIM_LOCUS18848 [Linum perenne]